MMDRKEVKAGGSAYWESHYAQFGMSSDFMHDPFVGVGVFALTPTGDEIHLDLTQDISLGVHALRWGGFYFVRGVDA